MKALRFKQLIWSPIVEWFGKLSSRERNFVYVTVFALGLVIIIKGVGYTSNIFSEQELRLTLASEETKKSTLLLQKYQQLQKRRAEIEQQFQQVELSESPESDLEKLLKDRFGTLFEIDDREPQAFGQNYEQITFVLKFKTTSLQKLVDFLTAVTQGKNPMLLTRLDILKSFAGDRLEVEMDVSSIYKPVAK